MRLYCLFLLVLAAALSAAQTADYRYVRLEGTIGTQPVVFHLHFQKPYDYQDASVKATLNGVYYYKRYDAPIDLYGDETQEGEIKLYESAGPAFEGQLTLKPVAQGEWSGAWQKGENGKPVNISLREAYPKGTVAFTGKLMEDRKPLFPGKPETPEAHVAMSYVWPANSVNPALRSFLESETTRQVAGDSLAALAKTPEKAYAAMRKSAFDNYPDAMLDGMPLDSVEYSATLNYDETVSTAVHYNDGNLLTIAVTHYWYTGGAHGNYATEYFSYNLEQKRRLTLEDLLKPGYNKFLERALNQAARERAGLKPGESISSAYFVETIPATDNFYRTAKGIVFSYPPYEIASYADGQVELFVPFEALKGYVKE